MVVGEILAIKGRDVHHISPSAKLQDAAAAMYEKGIGALLCLDEGGGIVGILSERDVARAMAAYGAEAAGKSVSAIMTRDVIACADDDDLVQMLEIMTETRCRHLPVVKGGEILGLVSIGDLLKAQLGF